MVLKLINSSVSVDLNYKIMVIDTLTDENF